MSLYPHSDQIEYPSEPSSQRTRLLTSDSILLNSLTSISGVLSVTVISPPFRLRWLNLHQNCLVDFIFILLSYYFSKVLLMKSHNQKSVH
ncbi:uncharacterized protein METZ01_LOCUS432128, partial [marine metagenome]